MTRGTLIQIYCSLILLPLAMAACAYPPPSPSTTSVDTPSSLPTPSLTPTRPAPTPTPPPSPTPGIFRPAAFSITEVAASAESLSLVVDPDFTAPPRGDHLLYFRIRGERGTGPRSAELRYASLDGLLQGRILSLREEVSLVGATPALNQLHLANFNPDEVIVDTVDWQRGTVRQLRLVGNPGLSEEQGLWSMPVHDLSSSAFSPDGRWLVWDCEPEGQYAWCLLDLQQEVGYTIVPGGELWDHRGERYRSRFRWAANSEWFLALCPGPIPDHIANCIVHPTDRQVRRLNLPLLSQAGYPPFVLPYNAISRDGVAAYDFRVDVDSDFQVAISDLDCGNNRCEEKVLGPLSHSGYPDQNYGWSSSGDRFALSSRMYDDPDFAELWVVSTADGGIQRILSQFRGILLDWAPNSEWLLMAPDPNASTYRLSTISTNGLFRPIVPDVEGWTTDFLAWWHVP